MHRRLSGKESTCQCRRCRRHGFDPWVRKIPWRRKWQPIPGFLPEKPKDRGAWWATVHGVTKSRTRLRNWAHRTVPGALASSEHVVLIGAVTYIPCNNHCHLEWSCQKRKKFGAEKATSLECLPQALPCLHFTGVNTGPGAAGDGQRPSAKVFYVSVYLILTTSLRGRSFCYSHFRDEETEAQGR